MSKKQNRRQSEARALEELSEEAGILLDQKKELERKSAPLRYGLGDLLKAHLEKGKDK